MTVLTAPSPNQALIAADPSFLSSGNLALLEALLIRARLKPDDFRVAVQRVQQPAHYPDLKALVTVTCPAARISRTYCAGSKQLDWFVDLSDDLQAGVFQTIVR